MSGTSYALDDDPRPGPLAAGLSVVRRHPLAALGTVIGLVALWLGIREGWHELAQSTLNGIVAGNYFALGAVGLTLIFGVLRLVNFAQGEFLTFGAYVMVAANALDLPLVVSAAFGILVTAALALSLEVVLWRPVRRKRGTRSRSSPGPRTGRPARTSPPA
jgi:neutral amino acid transport system permease protein